MRELAVKIVQTLKDAGYQAVFAGGCVRDQLLGIEPNDYDIATSATPDVVESLFPDTIPLGKAFGVIVVLMEGIEFEIATFRNDGNYTDGRRPDEVKFASMQEDAYRRDLTINGMFYDPVEDKIYDFVEGQEDLKKRSIRLIGNAQDRINEDKLRMLRVLRFAIRFDFSIHLSTYVTVSGMSAEITQVSAERISDEFLKILRTRKYRKALGLLFEAKFLERFLPEVAALRGVEQPKDYHPEGDVYEHTIKALEALPNDASDELVMATLLHDIGKPPTQTFEDRIRFNEHDSVGARLAQARLKKMKFSTEFIDHVVAMIANHMKFQHVKKMRMSTLKRFMRLPKFEEHLALHKADCISSHGHTDNYEFVLAKTNEFVPEQIRPTPLATGHDLIQMGLKPGPIFKRWLDEVEDKQLEGEITTREEALALLKKKFDIMAQKFNDGVAKEIGHSYENSHP